MGEVLDYDLARLACVLRQREISPVEVLSAALSRIERLDSHVRSFITVAHESALIAARRAESEIARGWYRGPLHGVPIALKDVISTADLRTTNGSRIFWDNVPREDAAIVGRLRRAGAIILGKNNLHELAMGSTSANPYFGICRNPWNLEHVPGGSSGGSAAAVAARFCYGAVATDTAGSIRSPASQCGVVGLKPSAGRVSRDAIFVVSDTLDHVGPIARTTQDAALILDAIAEEPIQVSPVKANDLAGVRIGVPTTYFFDGIDAEVEKLVREAIAQLGRLGAVVMPVCWPEAGDTAQAALTISAYEAARRQMTLLASRPDDFSLELRSRLESGLQISGVEYESARAKLEGLRQRFLDAMRGLDVLATPTNPVAAPRHGETMVCVGARTLPIASAMPKFGAPQNATGCPALSLPCGFTAAHLPVGLQLVARPLHEAVLFRLGIAYEEATPWRARRPPLLATDEP